MAAAALTSRLPPVPPVSTKSLFMAGIVVDIYGVSELSPDVETVTVLWLHHPRLRQRSNMANIAARAVRAVAGSQKLAQQRRGLVAVAFDQRNHGSRAQSETANQSWDKGNPTHAQDMFGVIVGAALDTSLLIDMIDGYNADIFGSQRPKPIQIVQHMVLGISLGGHSAWQLLFADPRVTAGVVVIGCPDYTALLSDRARRSGVESYTKSQLPDGPPFIGSYHFPPSLVQAVEKYDPRGIVFGRQDVTFPADESKRTKLQNAVSDKLEQHLKGKRILICSGGDDDLVPYSASEQLLAIFKEVVQSDGSRLQIVLRDNIYKGIGHSFSPGMVVDSISFILETMEIDVAECRPRYGSTTSRI